MNIRRIVYIAGFVLGCWLLIAAVYGMMKVLIYIFRNDSTLAMLAFYVIFYSCVFAFLGWQIYGVKGRDWKWLAIKRHRGWRVARKTMEDDGESGEIGWRTRIRSSLLSRSRR